MTFQQTGWLWALILVPFFLLGRLWFIRRRQEQFRFFADERTWPQIAPELDWGARKRKAFTWSLALTMVLVALARPQWGLKEEVVRVTGLDIIVALDVSNSMEVEDVIPNRLKKAHHFVHSLIDRLGSDRVGIVAFAASTYLACPLTTDHGYVGEILQGLGPRSILNQGTDIGLALETSVEALARGAEQEGDRDGTRVIVLVTDGEDLEEGALEGAKKVEQSGAKLYVIGIGSDKGGPIPVRDEAGALVAYRKDSRGQPIGSRMNPSALEQVASAAHGRYFRASQNESELDELVRDIVGLNRTDKLEKRRVTLEERFQFPLALAILILMIEMSISLRKKLLQAKAPVSSVLAIVLLLLYFSPDSQARESVEVYLENKKGLESFKKGNIDEARDHFGRAQAADPKRPELLFNQGVIQLDQKSLDDAAQGFSGAAKEAAGQNNSKLEGQSLYNLGGAQAAKGDSEGALRSFISGIDAAKAAKDPELEKDLRKKIELLIQNEQQKQKNKNDQSDQNQSKDEKEKQNQQNKDQDADSKSGGKPHDENQGKQSKDEKESQAKKTFKSQKLNKEDAERVMNELSEREKELQAKMTKQRGRPERRDRDW